MRCYLVAVICTACIADGARAQHGTDSVTLGCYQSAIAELRAKRPGMVMVRIATTPLRSQAVNAEMLVHNEGVYVERRDGPWHRFTYECRYSRRMARARVTVSFEGTDALRDASP